MYKDSQSVAPASKQSPAWLLRGNKNPWTESLVSWEESLADTQKVSSQLLSPWTRAVPGFGDRDTRRPKPPLCLRKFSIPGLSGSALRGVEADHRVLGEEKQVTAVA